MTMYGREYDGSDHGNWDGTDTSCDLCDFGGSFWYESRYLCADHLEELFLDELKTIIFNWLDMKGLKMQGEKQIAFENCQIDPIRNPKHDEFVGFIVSFDDFDDLDIPAYWLEAQKRKMEVVK